MTLPPAREAPRGEDGFALIEVLVSALIVVIVGGAVLTLLQTSARSAGDQRRHATAFALAQEDQARLRSSRLATLNRLNEERPVSVDGQSFTVTSSGIFVNNGTGTSSCVEGNETTDYAKISSSVTWPGARQPVEIDSIVAPSSGSLDPSHGTLAISVTNAAGVPLSGVSLSGSGAGTFSGASDETGCAVFADLPEGDYTLTSSAGGMVNEYGETIGSRTVGVRGSTTQPVQLRFDLAGEATISFWRWDKAKGAEVAAKADAAYFSHPELSGPGKVVGDPGGTRVPSFTTPLFPFTSPYSAYAGSCSANNPNPDGEPNPPGAAAIAAIDVTPGGLVEDKVRLPTLYVKVTYGSSPLTGAGVVVEDDECKEGYSYVSREYTTNSNGEAVPDGSGTVEPELPWGVYNVCAEAYLSGWRHRDDYNVAVENLTNGTSLSFNMSSGTSWGKC